MRVKKIAALALAAAMCGCPAEDPENVDDAQGALSSPTTSPSPEVLDAWAEQHLPRWKVLLIGENDHARGDDRRWSYPPSIDRAGRIVAVRAGEEENPKEWIALELEQHWMHGDAYLQVLMKQHGLTLLDLLMIHEALVTAGDEPPPAPNELRTMDCYECGPLGPIGPFGPIGGGDDHTGPAPGAWGPPVPPVPAPEPPRRGDRPSPSAPKPGKPDPKREEKQRAWSNGVRPGDPEPRPAPTDATYVPAPYEIKEAFKCEGSTYYGFKGGCVDFTAMSTSVKWALKIGLFLEGAGERLHREVLHQLFHDGKGDACRADCAQLGVGALTVGSGAVMAICVAATRGLAVTPCINGTSQIYAWLSAGAVGGSLGISITNYCSANVCTK